METAEQEEARVRAEVAAELEAEESGTSPVVNAAEPSAKTVVDPWEGVNPALKEQFESMASRVETLQTTEARLKQAESRIGSITNELSAARKAAETTKVAPTAEQMAAAAQSDEKWEDLKKDFPEWAEAFDGRFDKKLSTATEALKADIEALKNRGADEGKSETVIAEEVEKRLLTFFHPHWRQEVSTPEWKDWITKQSPERQALVSSTSASDAVSLLDSFHEERNSQKTVAQIAEERKRRLRTGALPIGGKATPVKSEADMSAAELRASIGREIFAD